MYDEFKSWAPVVAERERSKEEAAVAYPCRGPFNRYLGCIGARKCRSTGVTMCVLGRWPDERPTNGRPSRVPTELPVRRRSEPGEEQPQPAVAAAPTAVGDISSSRAGRRPLVGIVHDERRSWQQMSRQVANAGYEPVWLTSAEAARAALDGSNAPNALLVAGPLGAGPAGEVLTARAAYREVPVLSLPVGARGTTDLEAAARMALVWLAVTFQERSQLAAV